MAAFVVHRILTVAFLAGGAIGAEAALALTAASSAPAPIGADLA
jgi:hypothetical protein